MKIIPMLLIAAFVTAGCTYNGKLKSGFYSPPNTASKIPLKVNLICSDHFKSTIIDPGHIYGGYAVRLKTDPALQETLTTTCKSLFDDVFVDRAADPSNQRGADINLIPNLVMSGNILKFSLTVRDVASGEVIKRYEAQQNFKFGPPAGVRTLDIINIPFCGLLFPIVIPANTSMIGHRGARIFSEQMAACVGQVADEIRYDASLLSRQRR